MSPYKIPAMAGKPYHPSNGTEGELFMDAFCERCVHDAVYQRTNSPGTGCPIIVATMLEDYDSPDYPKEWIHTAEGEPVCTAFELEGDS